MQTTARNATLQDLATLLTEQQAHKLDVVAPASTISAHDGNIVLAGSDTILSAEGVTTVDGTYAPTKIFDEGLAEKLGVPLAYLRRLRAQRPDLYDANVNGWLRGNEQSGPDPRSFLIRAFTGDDDGIARAFLSDSYRRIDNLDILTSALSAVKVSGIEVDVRSADLSERQMRVVVDAPAIQANADLLLANYRSPFTGNTGADNPVVQAGLVIKNSETGGGAFSIAPHLRVMVCSNGMTMTHDAQRSVHLGGKLESGVVAWSDATQEKALELIQAKTQDAVNAFLDRDYLLKTVADLEAKAGAPLEGDKAKAVTRIGKALTYSEEQIAGIMDHFIQGGDTTVGGVMQAVTSYSQTVDDVDTAIMLEETAYRVLAHA
jgi:hypothetical protein